MSGWIFQKVLPEMVQKRPHFVTKMPHFKPPSLRLVCSKIDALSFKRQEIERSAVLIPDIFYERFFPSHKTRLKVCTVA